MSQPSHLQVYTDGACPLCRWVRARIEPRDRAGRIEWVDYRDPEALEQNGVPFSFDELNTEMHARRGDGMWAAGYRAVVEIMRVLPRWRVLAPILSLWPLTWAGKHFYRWLARRRYTMFGAPPPCDADGVCSLHAPHGR